MPAPFVPKFIQFGSGVRQDLGQIGQDDPSQLKTLENAVFTRRGALRGRPACRTRDAQVQTVGADGALGANLNSQVAGLTPAGLVCVSTGGALGVQSPLACWQGASYFYKDTVWVRAGTFWSLRATKSVGVATVDPPAATRLDPVPVGSSVVGLPTTLGITSGIPHYNSQGQISYLSLLPLGNYFGSAASAVAGNALFFINTSTGAVFGHIPGVLPAGTEVSVGSGASTTATPVQNISAVVGESGAYYVAYKSSTAGRITVVRLNSAGTVTQTLNLSGLGTVYGAGITYDGTSRLGIVWKDTAGPVIKTKILTITAGVMADASIDLTLTGTPLILLGSDPGTFHQGTTADGKFCVMFTKNDGSLYIGGRLFTAATETSITTLLGAYDSAGGYEWDPLFGAVSVGGRTLVGIQRACEFLNQTSQWMVMDVTSLYTANNTSERNVVAAGPSNGSARITPSSVYRTSTSVMFVVPEGVAFGAVNPGLAAGGGPTIVPVERAMLRRIHLELQPTRGAEVDGVTLLSGQLLHVFDGSTVRPHHFVEEQPHILLTTANVAGGSLTAGSYSYQTTWEAINARGQVLRSGASNLYNDTTVTLNQKVNVVTTVPQMWNYLTQADFVRVRLWATKKNPSAGADKFFVTETVLTTSAAATLTLVHSAEVTGFEEVLYQGQTTLADMRCPGADRGVAFCNERAWAADQENVYVSKLLRQRVGAAFNDEGTNTIVLPHSLGPIQGIAKLGERLIAVCASGVAAISGPGVDDSGSGIGWTVDVIDGAQGAGLSGPRSLDSLPQGVAYTASDGDVWLVGLDLNANPISRPMRQSGTSEAVDVVYVASTLQSGPSSSTNPQLFARGVSPNWRVLDTEVGQWGMWTFEENIPRYLASINGVPWAQIDQDPWIISADAAPGVEWGSNITARIITGVLKPAGVPKGWGRLRGLTLVGLPPASSTQINIAAYTDIENKIILNKTKTYSATGASTWPDCSPEFRAFSQRCGFVFVDMEVIPASFEYTGLNMWVSNTGEPAPSRNRS